MASTFPFTEILNSHARVSINARCGAEGIGLYRTEFLYLGSPNPPTEDEHFDAYSAVVRELKDKPVIIRTLDLGADKVKYDEDRKEGNPFLGCRSIRYCFKNPFLFKTQLRGNFKGFCLRKRKDTVPSYIFSSRTATRKANGLGSDGRVEQGKNTL